MITSYFMFLLISSSSFVNFELYVLVNIEQGDHLVAPACAVCYHEILFRKNINFHEYRLIAHPNSGHSIHSRLATHYEKYETLSICIGVEFWENKILNEK